MPIPADTPAMLDGMCWVIQKARSNEAEALPDHLTAEEKERILSMLDPWIWGAKGTATLNALVAKADAVKDGGKITALELYNFLAIFRMLCPVLGMYYDIVWTAAGKPAMPAELDTRLLVEWMR